MDDRLERLFDLALDVPPEERASWLDRECAGDAGVAQRLQALLSAHAANDRDGRVAPLPVRLPTEETPASIGEYRVWGAIGEGGIGAVFDTRHEVTGRRAAVKLIRTGFATSKQRLRFQLEAEILGKLNHPNIAHLYEAGVADVRYPGADGVELLATRRPFIAMEYVDGRPISAWAAEQRLGVRDRVRLLCEAAHAVEHAHQRGVIHRDLKPANVLVSGRGAVKVVDFGVAKLVERATAPDSEAAALTVAGAAAGTPAFMSPEQLTGRSDQIDLTTDVYGLGATLYFLLTGAAPVAATGLLTPAGAAAVLAREVPPIRSRNADVDADLAAVVHRAIEREPSRRYLTAAEFVADLERWVQSLPTLARPLGVVGRTVRYARRNTWKSAALATAAVGAVGGVIGLALIARSAARERAALADQQAALTFMNDMLVRASPESADALGPDRKLSDLVADAEAELARTSMSLPAQASVRLTLARINLGLGRLPAATTNAEAAVAALERAGETGLPRIEAIETLALIEREANRLNRVADLRYEAWQWRLKHNGESDPETLRSAVEVAVIEMEAIFPHGGTTPQALAKIRQLKELKARLGPAWTRQNELALIRSLELAAYNYIILIDDPMTLGPLLDEAIALATAVHGPDHPATVRLIRTKGIGLIRTGDLAAAKPLLESVYAKLRTRLGDTHPTVLNVEELLAGIAAHTGDPEAALATHRRLDPLLVERLGERHFRLLALRLNIAADLRLLGRLEEADALLARAIEATKTMEGPSAYMRRATYHELAVLRVAQGRLREAAELMHVHVFEGASPYPNFEGYRGEAGEWMLNYVEILEKLGELEQARTGAWSVKISVQKSYGPDAALTRRAEATWARLKP
jgi:serine/threonine protein kinase/tetratricopeptide (TPR) repeat protein